jgi:hypothetical protein
MAFAPLFCTPAEGTWKASPLSSSLQILVMAARRRERRRRGGYSFLENPS